VSRRDLILQEIGLKPQWTRRTLLAEAAAQAAQLPAMAAAPAVAEMPQESTMPAAPARPAKPDIRVEAKVVAPPISLGDTERAASIAAMDWPTLQEAVRNCRACSLCETRTQTVFSAGQPEATLMVVGEAPGADEDRVGEPFVGQAGKLLDSMLASIGRSRKENVYIGNALKCRPPQNRNPTPEEMALCTPFLHRQIELVAPKVLFTIGKFAIQALLERTDPIKNLRGSLHDYRGRPVVISYHPAYLLRNPPDKIKAWEDLLRVKAVLAEREGAGN